MALKYWIILHLMKISLMINNIHSYNSCFISLRVIRILTLMQLILISQMSAATPPKKLTHIIDHFMNMEATSLEVQQVIEWRFSSNRDSINFRMDVKAGRNFHLTLASFGMEIYVTEAEMMTINHLRQQILYEAASPHALINQLFVGGDLNDARFKNEKRLESDLRQLDFEFAGDFSDWESLSVIVDDLDDLKKIILIDYDGNKYLITLKYMNEFDNFSLPDIQQDLIHYQISDLRP